MATSMLLVVLGLYVSLAEVSTQKMCFPDQVIVDRQTGNWSAQGSVQLSNNDKIMFQPKVTIQTCSDLCTVDLGNCVSENEAPYPDACYCSKKVQDWYTIRIRSKGAWTQSGKLVTATIPSHEIFGSVSISDVIGKLPFISKESRYLDGEFFDVFETNNPEWRLAFRGSSGINQPVFDAYSNHQKTSVEPGCKKIFKDETCTNHYRNNDALDNWADIDEVAFVIVKGTQKVAHVTFDAAGSDFQNWLSQDRVVDSSWLDLRTQKANYFSTTGHAGLLRRFFMHHYYGNCSGDVGWFVAVDRHNVSCPWEKTKDYPALLYSKAKTSTNWSKGGFGSADYFAVLVKYHVKERDAEYFDIFGTDKKEWRIAFRGTPGINKSVLDAYSQKQRISVEPGCKKVYSRESCSDHFRNNDVLDNWSNIHQVAFVVFKGNLNVAQIVFDAVGSDNMSWFSQNRIVNSSWSDLKTQATNYFSIQGHDYFVRHFFIQKNYGGCSMDNGWFIAVDGADVYCAWESNHAFPKFFYATQDISANWSSGDVGVADYFAVFVKYF